MGLSQGRRISGDHFFLPYICMSVLIFILILYYLYYREKITMLFSLWKWKLLSHVRLFVTSRTAGILQTRILEWVALLFSRGSSQPRDQTQVSCIKDGFFTSWTTRETQEHWSGWPILSPADLPDSGIEPRSPALQADSLLTELSGTSIFIVEQQK